MRIVLTNCRVNNFFFFCSRLSPLLGIILLPTTGLFSVFYNKLRREIISVIIITPLLHDPRITVSSPGTVVEEILYSRAKSFATGGNSTRRGAEKTRIPRVMFTNNNK